MKKLILVTLFLAASFSHAAQINVLNKLTNVVCLTQNEDTITSYKLALGPSNPGSSAVKYIAHKFRAGFFTDRTVNYQIISATYDTSTSVYSLVLSGMSGAAGEMSFLNGGGGRFNASDDRGSGILETCQVSGNW